jgi:hypothetical protein
VCEQNLNCESLAPLQVKSTKKPRIDTEKHGPITKRRRDRQVILQQFLFRVSSVLIRGLPLVRTCNDAKHSELPTTCRTLLISLGERNAYRVKGVNYLLVLKALSRQSLLVTLRLCVSARTFSVGAQPSKPRRAPADNIIYICTCIVNRHSKKNARRSARIKTCISICICETQ